MSEECSDVGDSLECGGAVTRVPRSAPVQVARAAATPRATWRCVLHWPDGCGIEETFSNAVLIVAAPPRFCFEGGCMTIVFNRAAFSSTFEHPAPSS
jgi:hypothetical protein